MYTKQHFVSCTMLTGSQIMIRLDQKRLFSNFLALVGIPHAEEADRREGEKAHLSNDYAQTNVSAA